MARRIKKEDMVQVIAGDDKGATGKVLRVITGKNKVVVQGLNIALKHVKPSRKSPQGGRIKVEQPIHISNVQPVDTKTNKGTRVRFKIDKDGVKKRVSVGGTEIGILVRKKS
jgi:large subunit ribosomal protein L24